MNEDILKILKMVEDHKLKPEDAEKLITALGSGAGTKSGNGRFLHIHIADGGEDKVNVKVPLALAKTLLPLLPAAVAERLKEKQVDVGDIVRQLEGVAGDIVNVDSGKDRVRIWIV
ncbi:MAG: hypothetical protein V1809_10110 [Planctomycetota bacterium]